MCTVVCIVITTRTNQVRVVVAEPQYLWLEAIADRIALSSVDMNCSIIYIVA